MVVSYNHVCALTTVCMVFNKDGVRQKHNQRRREKIYWAHLQKISDQNKYPQNTEDAFVQDVGLPR